MQGVKLFTQHGANPTTPVCFWCGNERNEIALPGRIGDGRKGEGIEAPKSVVLDYEPCDKCRAAMEAGFTVMEATKNSNDASAVEIQDGVYPTGRFAVLTISAAERVFGGTAKNNKKVFLDSEIFSKMFEALE